MTRREQLIQNFIERFGKNIREEAEAQRNSSFFQEQWKDNDPDEILYSVYEEVNLTPMTLEESKKFKKKFKREEIKNKINFETIRDRVGPFDIIQGYYPYSDEFNIYSVRPMIIVPTDKDYVFVKVTKGKDTNPIYRFYEFELEQSKTNLDFKSYARVELYRTIDEVVFVKDYKEYGSISDDDIENLFNMRERYETETFINPLAFLCWLIMNKIKDTTPIDGGDNNNVNPIQTIEDIKESKEANCVDLAILVYKMLRQRRDMRNTTIARTTWIINKNHTTAHIYTVFKYLNFVYVFHYDQDHQIGELKDFKSDNFKKTIIKYSNWLKEYHPIEEVHRLPYSSQIIYILNSKELKELDDTSKFRTQRDWLDSLPKPYNRLEEFYEWLEKKDPISYALMEWCCK